MQLAPSILVVLRVFFAHYRIGPPVGRLPRPVGRAMLLPDTQPPFEISPIRGDAADEVAHLEDHSPVAPRFPNGKVRVRHWRGAG